MFQADFDFNIDANILGLRLPPFRSNAKAGPTLRGGLVVLCCIDVKFSS